MRPSEGGRQSNDGRVIASFRCAPAPGKEGVFGKSEAEGALPHRDVYSALSIDSEAPANVLFAESLPVTKSMGKCILPGSTVGVCENESPETKRPCDVDRPSNEGRGIEV